MRWRLERFVLSASHCWKSALRLDTRSFVTGGTVSARAGGCLVRHRTKCRHKGENHNLSRNWQFGRAARKRSTHCDFFASQEWPATVGECGSAASEAASRRDGRPRGPSGKRARSAASRPRSRLEGPQEAAWLAVRATPPIHATAQITGPRRVYKRIQDGVFEPLARSHARVSNEPARSGRSRASQRCQRVDVDARCSGPS